VGLAVDLEDYHPSVLLHCWLGHLTCKIVSEMTYNVWSGTLNPTIPFNNILLLCYIGQLSLASLWGRKIDYLLQLGVKTGITLQPVDR